MPGSVGRCASTGSLWVSGFFGELSFQHLTLGGSTVILVCTAESLSQEIRPWKRHSFALQFPALGLLASTGKSLPWGRWGWKWELVPNNRHFIHAVWLQWSWESTPFYPSCAPFIWILTSHFFPHEKQRRKRPLHAFWRVLSPRTVRIVLFRNNLSELSFCPSPAKWGLPREQVSLWGGQLANIQCHTSVKKMPSRLAAQIDFIKIKN